MDVIAVFQRDAHVLLLFYVTITQNIEYSSTSSLAVVIVAWQQ